MPFLSDEELRSIVDRIRYLEMAIEEAKTLAAALESNLIAATKKPDPVTGESDITMIENEKGRFMKLTMGPILIPASEFADKFSQDTESLWAANGPNATKASTTSTTDDKGTK
ncbi:hypothetical protein FocTR4_00012473 [Fusarium oxysporum f. sp. cubense]|uniref:Uncharacterized protein n=2 Tax=Fusarium oxysporum species complex TaxID=171631 RepID=A0A5C6SLA9_FUSOC|nr:hypothetical protein FocTR4_00012473 [Fusarium oxysporum f. sp. cubense]